MKSAFTTIVAVCLGLALAVPALAQDDDDLARLLKLRRATVEELTDVSLQLAQVELRQGSPDWVIFKVDDGSHVQIGPDRMKELIPWVKMALADQGTAPVLLEALYRRYPEAALAAKLPGLAALGELKPYLAQLGHLVAGQIEALDSAMIFDVLRSLLADETLRTKLQIDVHYAALDAELKEQRQALEVLLRIIDADIEASAGALPLEPSPQPSLDPCAVDGENAVDILCSDWGDEATPAPEADPTWEPSLPPTEIEELPTPTTASTAAPTPEPEPSPEATPGMESEGIEYDALEGLTHCDADDPDCAEATPAPCSEADMWCDDPAAKLAASPAPSPEPRAAGHQGNTGIVCNDWMSAALEAPYTTLSPAQIGACFHDCEEWMSWHASFGDVLPSWCGD